MFYNLQTQGHVEWSHFQTTIIKTTLMTSSQDKCDGGGGFLGDLIFLFSDKRCEVILIVFVVTNSLSEPTEDQQPVTGKQSRCYHVCWCHDDIISSDLSGSAFSVLRAFVWQEWTSECFSWPGCSQSWLSEQVNIEPAQRIVIGHPAHRDLQTTTGSPVTSHLLILWPSN